MKSKNARLRESLKIVLGAKPLPEHLRRVDIDVDVSVEDRHAMGDDWLQIGWESSEQLACQEREYFVKRIRRAKYGKKEQNPLDKTDGIKTAPTLPVMLPRAIADASLLAKIITGKLVAALSFNRECKVLHREGVDISYSTLCNYSIQLHERLQPLKALFYEYAAEQPLWHLDETTLQVLQEPGRKPRQKSYIWVMRAGPPGKQMVIFHYDPRRNYEAFRPFTLGRRNWLYSVSPRGAHASAFMYSLVESAKACGLEPRHYLHQPFERFPHAKTVEQQRELGKPLLPAGLRCTSLEN